MLAMCGQAPSAGINVLRLCLQVRAALCNGLSSGPRNDAPDAALAMRQRWRLAELRAEEYAFVLLSQFTNAIEAQVHTRQIHHCTVKHEAVLVWKPGQVAVTRMFTTAHLHLSQGGAAQLSAGQDPAWALPIGAAVLGVRHMGLGGWQPQECMAVENELAAWLRLGELNSRDNALRCMYLPTSGVQVLLPSL